MGIIRERGGDMRGKVEEVLNMLRYKKKRPNEFVGIKDGIISISEIKESKGNIEVTVKMMIITDNIRGKDGTLLQIELNKLETKLRKIGLDVFPCGYASIPNGRGMYMKIPIKENKDLNKITSFTIGMKDEYLKIIKKMGVQISIIYNK